MRKVYIYGILGLVILALVLWSIVNQNSNKDNTSQSLRDNVEVSLTDEQKSTLEKHISDINGKIEAAKAQDVPEQEVFRLHMDLGLAHYGLGNLKLAKEAYLAALDMDPRNPGVWVALMPVYRDMYDYEKARDAARKVLSVNPQDWNVWRSLIEFEQFHFNADRNDLDKLYKEALDKSNHELNIVTVYAKFLEDGGDKRSALNYWKIAAQQQPNNQLFKQEITRLESELKN